MAVRMALSRSSPFTGLVRKSTAPRFIACTLMGMSPWPVRKTIGGSWPLAIRACWSSRPFSPGMATSSTRQPGSLGSWQSKNSCGEEKVATARRAERSTRARLFNTAASSSTTKTVGGRAGMRKGSGFGAQVGRFWVAGWEFGVILGGFFPNPAPCPSLAAGSVK